MPLIVTPPYKKLVASLGPEGYFSTGWNGTASTTAVNGLRFTDETIYTVATTLLAKLDTAGVHSSTNGYFVGGRLDATSASLNTIQKFSFATTTAATIASTTTTMRRQSGGLNSTTKGYIWGGYATSNLNTVDALTFSNDAVTSPGAWLAQERQLMADLNSSSTSKGYAAGGQNAAGFSYTEIDGVNFATDTPINPAAALSANRSAATGVNSGTRGYICGGGISLTIIQGLTFATETMSGITATLPAGKGYAAGVSSSTKGYIGGGYATSAVTNGIASVNFTTETTANTGLALSTARSNLTGIHSGGAL